MNSSTTSSTTSSSSNSVRKHSTQLPLPLGQQQLVRQQLHQQQQQQQQQEQQQLPAAAISGAQGGSLVLHQVAGAGHVRKALNPQVEPRATALNPTSPL
jgi:hypothetical protein